MALLKKLSVYGLIYCSLIALFIGLLTFSAALPKTKLFEKNMRHSSKDLAVTGDYYHSSGVRMDNYTDSLILNIAYGWNPRAPFDSAVRAVYSYYTIPGEKGVIDLLHLTEGQLDKRKTYFYWRYWFGQSAIIKILHYAMHLNKLYAFIGFVSMSLLFLCCLQTLKTCGKLEAFSLFILLGLCNFHVFFLSLQYYPVIWIGLGGLLFLLRKDDLTLRGPVFFTLGMLTAYFDLLTAPILTFGIPALIICGKDLHQETVNGHTGWKTWIRIWFGYPAIWLAGYAASWGTKILLGIWCCGTWNQFVHQITLRTGSVHLEKEISRGSALLRNVNNIIYDSTLVFFLLLAVLVVLLIMNLLELNRGRMFFDIRFFLGYLTLAVIPVAIILLMANHTFLHAYFTYRGMAMSFAALLMTLTAFRPVFPSGKPN